MGRKEGTEDGEAHAKDNSDEEKDGEKGAKGDQDETGRDKGCEGPGRRHGGDDGGGGGGRRGTHASQTELVSRGKESLLYTGQRATAGDTRSTGMYGFT